jgi:preprotein translocase subunit SecA
MDVSPGRIRADSPEDLTNLEEDLRQWGKDEASNVVSVTLGEYMDEESEPEEWDLRGLSSWAMSRFNVSLPQAQLRKMQPKEVEDFLTSAAAEKIDQINLADVAPFLQPGYERIALADWAGKKFGIQVAAEELAGERAEVEQTLWTKVEQSYHRREIEYPVEYAMDMTIGAAGMENVYALTALVDWANRKYLANLTPETFREAKPQDIYARLVAQSEDWLAKGRLEREIRQDLGTDPNGQAASEYLAKRFDTKLSPEELNDDPVGHVVAVGREFLRREMTELERFVLLQIYDSTWKDHLLIMDHLKAGIALRGYAEQDPRVAYKREGAAQYQLMLVAVREKVTDMIFKVRLSAGQEMASVYQVSSAVHEQLQGYDHLARDMADQAAAAAPQKPQTIRHEGPRVGRNDLCPCGSGKKYKKCHGKGK